MDLKRFDCKNTLIDAMHSGINLFVGAGFSVYAKDKNEKNLPTGNKLIEELHTIFGSGQQDLARYCSVMEKKNKTALIDYLTKRFRVSSYDKCYLNLNLINLKGVYTTNIDDLIPQIIEKSDSRYVNYQHTNGDCIDERGVNYLPLHGYVQNPERGYVFSVEKIANIFNQATRIWSYLSAALEKYPTVFIGYGLNDAGVIEAITSEQTFQNAQKSKWIVLYNPTKDDIEYFESMGFNIIIADTKEFLGAIETFDEWDNIKANQSKDIEKLLPANIIPKDTRGQIQRPIEEFYRGLPPKWTDILRNVIYKTSHYKNIEDSIFNRQKGTIIIGSPISGKTTLSMQVGYFIQYSGVKLFFTDLNQGRANYISKIIGNKNALLIVENFTDDIQAFMTLKALPNVKLVGVDRSHNFGYVSHLIDKNRFDIINVTPLTEFDIQGIIDTIPDGIRKSEAEIRKSKPRDMDESIFEFVIRYIKGESVKNRYKNFIDKLEIDDIALAEFLVLCAYMHAARVPLSMEVAYSYFDDFSYSDVIDMRDQLADFLKEDDAEELAQNNINGYRPRSSITSDAILAYVSPVLLAKVLNTLIDNVSYVKICNFKTFRKWAFDKVLMSKAFPNWEEGKNFYEKAFLFDNKNPYVLQQGALYLSSKQKYQEAFDWIDKAKILTNDRQFSIRNSHAIIMFEANYNIKTDEAEDQLDRSMEILHKCFNDDMRKTFHAKTYADQALRYYKKYNNPKSIEYLRQSLVWLEQERNANTWAFDLKSYINKVRDALRIAGQKIS
ncbi:SIR2 family protein [Prevotella melaninogenica]|uniref:SIR2 family protein n=1 Tax=Prevotella melaninogenica TaxID=28132 RepID=UPI001BA57A02|nr:SIR2 family protein [Prevotella melaninogenica]QUB63544.1 SIR2 family protein [Prevotella melaninogenica]